jgi:tetratricopeptide (TPR) repeat protein
MHGVAIFSGPGFCVGASIGAPTLLDITPTALAALGLPVGLDMDGRVVAEAFAVAPTIATVPSWDDVPGEAGMHPPEMRQDPFEASSALQQLIDLGYMADMGGDHKKLVELTRRESQFNLGVVLMTTGRAALAVPIFIKLVAEFPGEARYLSLLVHCQHSAGDHAAALASLEQWEQYAPGNAEAAMLRVVSLIALDHDAAAALAMETLVLQHGSAPERARPIADILALLGQWQASSEYAARAVEHDSIAPEPRLSAARAALELGNFEQCAEFCMDATERDMAIPEAHHLLGAALAWAGELEHASQSFEIALKFAPKNRESLAFAAAVERARGNAAAAAELDARLAECSTHDALHAAPTQLNRHSVRHAKTWNERGRS